MGLSEVGGGRRGGKISFLEAKGIGSLDLRENYLP